MLIITIAYDIEKGTVIWGPLSTEGTLQVNLLHVARAVNAVQQEVFLKLEISAKPPEEVESAGRL